jgi:hypothetical protein
MIDYRSPTGREKDPLTDEPAIDALRAVTDLAARRRA